MSQETAAKERPNLLVCQKGPQLVVTFYGQELIFSPSSPQQLWDWVNLYSTDPWQALLQIGYKPFEEIPTPQRVLNRPVKLSKTSQELLDELDNL